MTGPKRESSADRHPVLFAMGFGGLLGFWIISISAAFVGAGLFWVLVWFGVGLVLFVGTGFVAGGIDIRRRSR